MPVTDEHYLGTGNTEKNEIQSRSSRNQSPMRQTKNSIPYSEMTQQKIIPKRQNGNKRVINYLGWSENRVGKTSCSICTLKDK